MNVLPYVSAFETYVLVPPAPPDAVTDFSKVVQSNPTEFSPPCVLIETLPSIV